MVTETGDHVSEDARPFRWNNPAAPLTIVPITAAQHCAHIAGHRGE